MIEAAVAIILYVCSFPCLYGVLRLAVRHGIQDADQARFDASWHGQELAARQAQQDAALQARTFVPENAYLAGG